MSHTPFHPRQAGVGGFSVGFLIVFNIHQSFGLGVNSIFFTGDPRGDGRRQRRVWPSPSPRPPAGLQDILGRDAPPGTGPSGSLCVPLGAFQGLLETSGEPQEGPEKA